jgi:hypothetical protein
MAATNADLEIARAALLAARREIMKRLLAAALVENDPERRQMIMHNVSKLLNKERYAARH